MKQPFSWLYPKKIIIQPQIRSNLSSQLLASTSNFYFLTCTMLAKRLIPCLDVKDGRVVKGTNFQGLRDAGDPVELAHKYYQAGADELVFLDITATLEKRKTLLNLASRVAEQVFIPFTIGGGIGEVDQIESLIQAGADKVSLNSAAVKNPKIIQQAARAFGSQAVVIAIDAQKTSSTSSGFQVFVSAGTKSTDWDVLEWAQKVESLGAGEILLTSIDADGTKAGYCHELNQLVTNAVNIPVIASGGAGKFEHFLHTFQQDNVDAALASSVFHYQEIHLPDLKHYLHQNNIPMRI